jgi:hypothetical protein
MEPIPPRKQQMDAYLARNLSISEKIPDSCDFVRWYLRQIDGNTWDLFKHIVFKRQADKPSSGVFWPDSACGGYFTLSESPVASAEEARSVRNKSACMWLESFYQDDRDLLERSGCAWVIGDATLHAQTRFDGQNTAHVDETLATLLDRKPSFEVPRVIWSKTFANIRLTLCTNLAGQRLTDVWPAMEESAKQRIAAQVAAAHDELTSWEQDSWGGLNGKENMRPMVPMPRGVRCYFHEFSSKFPEFGYDCSKYVFSHNSLMPDNVIVDAQGQLVGIKDWTWAAFVPADLARTQMRYCQYFQGQVSRALVGYHPYLDMVRDFSNLMDVQLGRLGYDINPRSDLCDPPKILGDFYSRAKRG